MNFKNMEIEINKDQPLDDGLKCVCHIDAIEIEAHICPYAQDVNGCYDLCNCCEYCTNECARDI